MIGTIKNENEFFRDLYYKLLDSYMITVHEEYKFIHEFFLKHLISDTKKQTNKFYNPNRPPERNEYDAVVFRGCLYRHLSNGKWHEKLENPNKFIELKRVIRKEKIKKLENGSM